MKFTVSVDKHAAKFLRNLTDAKLYSRIRSTVDSLADDPFPPGHERIKGAENKWRIRVGDYRIVYAVFQQELVVLVVAIGHRKDIYR